MHIRQSHWTWTITWYFLLFVYSSPFCIRFGIWSVKEKWFRTICWISLFLLDKREKWNRRYCDEEGRFVFWASHPPFWNTVARWFVHRLGGKTHFAFHSGSHVGLYIGWPRWTKSWIVCFKLLRPDLTMHWKRVLLRTKNIHELCVAFSYTCVMFLLPHQWGIFAKEKKNLYKVQPPAFSKASSNFFAISFSTEQRNFWGSRAQIRLQKRWSFPMTRRCSFLLFFKAHFRCKHWNTCVNTRERKTGCRTTRPGFAKCFLSEFFFLENSPAKIHLFSNKFDPYVTEFVSIFKISNVTTIRDPTCL